MSDKPISVGDMVQVVRPSTCVGGNDGIGHVFPVLSLRPAGEKRLCAYCRQQHQSPASAEDVDHWWPLTRLKRIPPLDELESEKRDEEITA